MTRLIWMMEQDNCPSWVGQHFAQRDWALWQPDCVYDDREVFIHHMYGRHRDKITDQLARGHRVVYDARNEHFLMPEHVKVVELFGQYPGQGAVLISGQTAMSIPGIKIIACPIWYWVMDQANWLAQGMDQWRLQPRPTHDFWMPMGLARTHRDQLWSRMEQRGCLDRGLVSYRARGIFLPDDTGQDDWQRYINPQWIASTHFSVVVETFIDLSQDQGVSLTLDDELFICEKTFKPLAMGHPFVMVSTYHNLAYVRHLGFETFDEVFDQSYDNERDTNRRIEKAIDAMMGFDPAAIATPAVRAKLAHNFDRFWDQKLVRGLLDQTVMAPLEEWIDAT